MRFLNLDILKNPFNWFVILTMILFGLFLMALVSPASE